MIDDGIRRETTERLRGLSDSFYPDCEARVVSG